MLLANSLVDANLANWSPSDELFLHDLALAYARAASPDLSARHGALADAYQRVTRGGWADHPAAPYMLEHLPWHLEAAAGAQTPQELLVDYAWLSAHIAVFGTTHRLELQVGRYGANQDHRLLGALLRQMRHVLRSRPGQLPEQLIGRIFPDDPATLLVMAETARRELKKGALVPMRPSLRKPSTDITLVGHGGGVTSVAVSPDGRRAVSGSHDRTLRVWDLESGEISNTLYVDSPVGAVAVRGQDFVAGDNDGRVHALHRVRDGT